MQDQLEEPTKMITPQEGKSKIFFIILTLVILLVGGLVGYYILEQQKFLDNEIDRLVIDDQGRVERKVIRSMTEKIEALKDSVVGENNAWQSYTVFQNLGFSYPSDWHVLVQTRDIYTVDVSMNPDPITRVEGGWHDPVTLTVSVNPEGETEGQDQLSTPEEYTTVGGNTYMKTSRGLEEGEAWFSAQSTYAKTISDTSGNDYQVFVRVLDNHSEVEGFEIDALLDSLVIVEPESNELSQGEDQVMEIE